MTFLGAVICDRINSEVTPANRQFTGWINVEQHYLIGYAQALRQTRRKVAGAGKKVGLENDPQTFLRVQRPQRTKESLYFAWVMGIIVDIHLF